MSDKTEEKKAEKTTNGAAVEEPTAGGPTAQGSRASESTANGPADSTPHPYEEILDDYPLRDAVEDPVWSVRIVKGWIWFLAICGGGIVLLTVLGFFFD
jgi:hypothetical protein